MILVIAPNRTCMLSSNNPRNTDLARQDWERESRGPLDNSWLRSIKLTNDALRPGTNNSADQIVTKPRRTPPQNLHYKLILTKERKRNKDIKTDQACVCAAVNSVREQIGEYLAAH